MGYPATETLPGLLASAALLKYDGGSTIAEIATSFAVTWEEAAEWLQECRVFTDRRRVLSPEQTAEIEQRVLSAGSPETVARTLGLTVPQMSALVGRRKRSSGAPVGVTEQQVQDMLARRAAGEPAWRIGQQLGLTTRVVAEALEERGVTTESREPVGHAGLLTAVQPDQVLRGHEDGAAPSVTEQIARLSRHRQERVVDRCVRGAAVEAVAAEYGIEVRAVQRLLRQHRQATPAPGGGMHARPTEAVSTAPPVSSFTRSSSPVRTPRPAAVSAVVSDSASGRRQPHGTAEDKDGRLDLASAQIDDAVLLFAEGLGARAIASRLRVRVAAVAAALQERGVPRGALGM